jgi:TPR repeat protein
MKSGFAKDICNGVCERKIYGEFEDDKLKSLCDDNDSTACLRYAFSAGKTDKGAAAGALQGCCDRKNVACCGILGRMYRRGKLLDKDPKKGYPLLEKACNMGIEGAKFCASPGLHHMRKDNKKAKALFENGCKGDSKASCGMLGVMYRDGMGIPRDKAKAKTFMTKACTLGYKVACKAVRRL